MEFNLFKLLCWENSEICFKYFAVGIWYLTILIFILNMTISWQYLVHMIIEIQGRHLPTHLGVRFPIWVLLTSSTLDFSLFLPFSLICVLPFSATQLARIGEQGETYVFSCVNLHGFSQSGWIFAKCNVKVESLILMCISVFLFNIY